MLYDFLIQNEVEILVLTEKKTLDLAGSGPSSAKLKQGLPIFFQQLKGIIRGENPTPSLPTFRKDGMAEAARNSDEPAMADAAGRPEEVAVAKSAGLHGIELLRLGYTLSHVVHAYGAMCQAITELAAQKDAEITTIEFHDLNQCLDVAIAGAVTEFEFQQTSQESTRELEHLGFLAHELRNALSSVTISLQLIKRGTVGFGGSTGRVMERGLKRIEDLIDRSLTEVRLRVDPKVRPERGHVLQLIDQIVITAREEASKREQNLDIQIDPELSFEVDHQLFHSAVSNLIQNAIKYTRVGGRIQVRAMEVEDSIWVEVEDECGGLTDDAVDLFRPFEQQNENRKGLGLGLTIARRAVELNHGTIELTNMPKRGCIFKIVLPKNAS